MSNEDIAAEQTYISMLYGRLDELRERASRRLAGVLRQQGGTHQARTEREVFSLQYSQQIAQLDAAENRLCFGRLDFTDGERRYIGRIGIHADADDYEPLLMDWRAPAARPVLPGHRGVPGGRPAAPAHRTRDREVTSLDDEVLDLAVGRPGAGRDGLTSEAALLAALTASRTGRMRDIVETIQAEQDRIIRSPLPGVLVVQGGPGTGKTAVALHRAAYLLYTHRDQLLRRGVLVVGPNATFLRYIGQVLPSLGETSVLLSTMGELFPGVDARPPPSPRRSPRSRAAPRWPGSSPAAVRDRQRVPRRRPGARSSTGTRSCCRTTERPRRPRTGPAAPGGRTTRPGRSSPGRCSRADRRAGRGPAGRRRCSAARTCSATATSTELRRRGPR